MTRAYSDPTRESDTYALPDIEVFFMSADEFRDAHSDTWMHDAMSDQLDNAQLTSWPEDVASDAATALEGWYWWTCFPGCLPDSEPSGPFKTEDAALEDARDF